MTKEQAIEQLKDLKAVYSGAVQAGEISIASMIKGGIDLIEKLQKENEYLKAKLEYKQYGDLDNAEFEKYINDIVESKTKELREQLEEEQELNKIIKETRINKVLENNIEVKRLREENEELKADNLEYQRIQDISDKRTYRKKYLEERRKEEPNLLYPDSDEIYQRYYELKEQLANSIPIKKVKDKIEEIKKRKMDIVTHPLYSTAEKLEILNKNKIRIQVLKELLEKCEYFEKEDGKELE